MKLGTDGRHSEKDSSDKAEWSLPFLPHDYGVAESGEFSRM